MSVESLAAKLWTTSAAKELRCENIWQTSTGEGILPTVRDVSSQSWRLAYERSCSMIYKEQHKPLESYICWSLLPAHHNQTNILSQWKPMLMLLSASSVPPTRSSGEPVLRSSSSTTRSRQPRPDTTVPELWSACPSDTPTVSSWPAWKVWETSSTSTLQKSIFRTFEIS